MSASLDRELAAAIERGAESVARRYGRRTPVTFSKGRGTVEEVNADGTLDVAYQGAVLQSVLSTTACANVEVGDSVLLEFFDARAYATGVIAGSSLAVEGLRTDFAWKAGWTAWSADMSTRESPCFTRRSGVVSVFGAARNSNSVSAGVSQPVEICVLPEGYRPVKEYVVRQQLSQLASCMIGVRTDGTIYVERASTTTISAGSWVNIACTFIASD